MHTLFLENGRKLSGEGKGAGQTDGVHASISSFPPFGLTRQEVGANT